MQPLVLSPKVWMWKPRLALASLPVMSQEMVVGADSDSCTRVTVPETLESPRTTATAGKRTDISELSTLRGWVGIKSRTQRRSARQASTAHLIKDDGWAGDCKAWPSGCLSTFLEAHQGAADGLDAPPHFGSPNSLTALRGLCVCVYIGTGVLLPALTILTDLMIRLLFIDS